MASVLIDRVEKTFAGHGEAITALKNVSLEVRDHEFVSIVGASGCGKSTLLNLVAGFETPTSGRLSVDGKTITKPGPDRGVVFQHSALFPWLSVQENIEYGLTLKANRGIRHEGLARVDELIERIGLDRFRKHFPAQLSGGMRQRAAIASVLAINPSILLMDEPLGALDALTRSVMQDLILEIWQEHPKTVLLVTHDISEAVYLSDRVVIMTSQPGRVEEIVSVDLPRPRDFSTQGDARFIELRNHILGLVRREAQAAA